MTFLSVINHVSSATFLGGCDSREKDVQRLFKRTDLVTVFLSLCSIYIQLPVGGDTHKWTLFQRIHWPCFSLLMKQKLESLHRLTNPFKCLIAVLLLVLISKRMGLAGLSEVINIRGHKAMLIEWSPHCHAQGVSLLAAFLYESFSFHSDSPTPFSLVCLSYKFLGDPPLLALAFPTDSSKKTGLVWSGWKSCWESLAPLWIQI